MARIRSIKPEFWTSEQVMNCSRDARCLFIGMWNFCDDGGNHPASAITLKAEVLPGDVISPDTVMTWVDELIEQGLVAEYEVDGKEFWHVTGWHHQRIDQPTLRHPKGDAGDAETEGDAKGDARHLKRLGGKQRQLILKKLRHLHGDACQFCGDASTTTVVRVASDANEEASDTKGFRLICSTCKRKKMHVSDEVTRGDAKVTRGDTEGDSSTEWSGVESKGVEGSGGESIKTPVEQQQDSHVEGDAKTEVTQGDASPRAQTPNDSSPVSRAIEIAIYLRQRGVTGANSVNPNIAAWGDDARVTNEILDAALSKARVSLNGKPLGPNYLATIIPDLLNPKPAQAPKQRDDWYRSDAGISRKASELGLMARGGETYANLRERCEAEIRKRAQGIAA